MARSIFDAGQHDPANDTDMEMTDQDTEHQQSSEVDVARAGVEQTRCEIGGTLNAIKEKLDPPTLMQQAKETVLDTADQLRDKARDTVADITGQAKDAVHDATIGRAQEAFGGAVYTARHTGETIMDNIRENPLPVALIGIGLGWLYMNSRRHPHHQWTREYNNALPYQDRMSGGQYASGGQQPEQGYGQNYGPSYGAQYYGSQGYGTQGYSGRGEGMTGNPVSERLGDLRDRAGDMAGQVQDRVSETAGQMKERVSQVAGTVQDRAGQLAGTVQDRAGQLAGTVQDRAQWAQDSVQRTMHENPVAIGVVALGLGALLGLMLPATEPENRLMGETRDRLVDQGQQMAQSVAQKVGSVAQEGLSAAKEAAQNQMRDPEQSPAA